MSERRDALDRYLVEEERPGYPWQQIYADRVLQISFRGKASAEQQEQVRIAAELIKKILSDK